MPFEFELEAYTANALNGKTHQTGLSVSRQTDRVWHAGKGLITVLTTQGGPTVEGGRHPMPAEGKEGAGLSNRVAKAFLAATGVYNAFFGAFLLLQLGIKGFTGGGGEDNPLFQLIGYVSIVMLALSVLSFLVARRPSRRPVLVLAPLLIVVGVLLFLFTLFVFGIIDVALGIAALIVRRTIPRQGVRLAQG